MALSFKNVAEKTLKGPGILLSKITDLLFGYEREQKEGEFQGTYTKWDRRPHTYSKYVENTNGVEVRIPVKQRPGLLGLIANGVQWLGSAISSFMYNNRMGAGIWFWSSLFVAGAAALTLFLWPAALAAVAGVSVFGVSIGAIAGASVLAQIGLSAAVIATAVTAANIIAGVVKGIVNSIKGCIRSVGNLPEPHVASSTAATVVPGSHRTINQELGGPVGEGVPFAVSRQQHSPASYTALYAGEGKTNSANVSPPTSPEVVSTPTMDQ